MLVGYQMWVIIDVKENNEEQSKAESGKFSMLMNHFHIERRNSREHFTCNYYYSFL